MIKFLFILFIIVGCSQNDSKIDMPSFNEQRAFQHLINQCSYGPRNPGSLGYNNFSIYLEQYLKNLSSNIIIQDFTYLEHITGVERNGKNFII